MESIHIKSLEKYHPGYKDRTLQWAKIYFNMAKGDSDCEIIENEIDWGRLVRMILLELRNQKPLPNNDRYWLNNGFDIKRRPIELTLQSLHNFIEIVTVDEKLFHVDKDKDKDKIREDSVSVTTYDFMFLWDKYPNQDGKIAAERHFKSTVKTDKDWEDIQTALGNYLKSEPVAKGFIKNGSTWFNNWRDWIVPPRVDKPTPKQVDLEYQKTQNYLKTLK